MTARPTTLRTRRLVAVLATTAAIGALGACGAGSVAASDLESQVTEQLAAQGNEPEAVDCPEDLPAEDGAAVTCTTTFADGDYDTQIEVTGVEGNEVSFNITIEDGPN